jgi:hypothetical protein
VDWKCCFAADPRSTPRSMRRSAAQAHEKRRARGATQVASAVQICPSRPINWILVSEIYSITRSLFRSPLS